jgi:hypothetical protein|mmetsp:Transcript_36562/g.82804  ORF Transcript_36562/g.82804 Transcript_36562/m.82804 type:complete len:86 (+) Transcript_36562:901-1158(+)
MFASAIASRALYLWRHGVESFQSTALEWLGFSIGNVGNVGLVAFSRAIHGNKRSPRGALPHLKTDYQAAVGRCGEHPNSCTVVCL